MCHFQKILIVLVLVMLLTTLNMRAYSIVGNYKTSSLAIEANKKNNERDVKERSYITFQALAAGLFAAAVVCVGFSLGIAKVVKNSQEERSLLALKYVDSYYIKYDFSQFDN